MNETDVLYKIRDIRKKLLSKQVMKVIKTNLFISYYKCQQFNFKQKNMRQKRGYMRCRM